MSEHDNERRPQRKPAERIHRLTMAQQFALVSHVREHYTASKQMDGQFAASAGETLGLALTAANIAGVREAFGIQSNRDLAREERKRPQNRLEAIEASVLALSVRVQKLEGKLADLL